MVDAALRREGHKVGAIHGDFTQQKRDAVMRRFRNGKISILVATDVAARGLDIDGVSHVVNHSVPQNTERYIHRIGRTGRMGKPGVAITFVTPDKHRQFKTIEQGARTSIHRKKLPVSPAMERLWNDDSRVKMFGFASQKKSAFSSAHPLR
jgi:ATP-dependent RNA helicase DeaD